MNATACLHNDLSLATALSTPGTVLIEEYYLHGSINRRSWIVHERQTVQSKIMISLLCHEVADQWVVSLDEFAAILADNCLYPRPQNSLGEIVWDPVNLEWSIEKCYTDTIPYAC